MKPRDDRPKVPRNLSRPSKRSRPSGGRNASITDGLQKHLTQNDGGWKVIAGFKVPRRYELGNYERNVKFSKPSQLAAFSRIKGRPDSYSIGGNPPVYTEPKPGASLVEGFAEYKEPVDDSTLDSVTDAVKAKYPKLLPEFKGFVSYRNNLNKILATPYLRNDYQILVQRTQEGWTRLDIVKTPDPVDERSRRFMYMGRRFEDICTPSSSTEAADEKNREHCVVMRIKLGEHEMLVGAEIDAISAPADAKDASGKGPEYVELKTSALIESSRQQNSFERYKLLKFWIQSFLVGVPIIKCGFRKGEILHKIETFKTLKIPSMVRGKGVWNGNVCLNFANQLLSCIKHKCSDPTKVYKISFGAPWDRVSICEKLS